MNYKYHINYFITLICTIILTVVTICLHYGNNFSVIFLHTSVYTQLYFMSLSLMLLFLGYTLLFIFFEPIKYRIIETDIGILISRYENYDTVLRRGSRKIEIFRKNELKNFINTGDTDILTLANKKLNYTILGNKTSERIVYEKVT